MKKMMKRVKAMALNEVMKVNGILKDTRGEGYIDTAVKILIAVVLGALLYCRACMLYSATWLCPHSLKKIKSMFNYARLMTWYK